MFPMSIDERFAAVSARVPDILLPADGIDLERWAVVACDQYTSQPAYWAEADALVGDAPSTLRLVFPEVFLEEPGAEARVTAINEAMRSYVDGRRFRMLPHTLVLVGRTTATGVTRWGLMIALDLEAYSWAPDARTPIRATEGTILDRLPPRVAIRESAALELPHILVLIDDPGRTVIEPLVARRAELKPVYRSDLMLGGGRVAGWAVSADADLAAIADSLAALAAGADPDNPLLYAMGDGNHSFATAKSIWETVKLATPPHDWADHPARYCLVELGNIFDEGIEFEPIHRVAFGVRRIAFEAELVLHCDEFVYLPADDLAGMHELMAGEGQRIGFCDSAGFGVFLLDGPDGAIPAATVQHVLDALLAAGVGSVDYIHGDDVTATLGRSAGNLGIFLPAVAKDTFFGAIVTDGALPRKTFSMGEAADKRYYLEARLIN